MAPSTDARTLFLCGDLMTGRGIDQILPHPSRPRLYERFATSALDYVSLAERAHGAIPRPAELAYVWGDALAELEWRKPAARIVNLETSVTTSEEAEPKGINYRMHPANAGVLAVAAVDCAVLANNHVLDWGRPGLRETLDTLRGAGVPVAGAGDTIAAAEAPAILELGEGRRVLVFAFAATDSGVPREWSATETRPGVAWLPEWSARTAARVGELVAGAKCQGAVAIASVHWGPNWGYEIPAEARHFAHELIDVGGVDVVYGHSSHHVKAIEVHHGRAILYGCGDFLNDYEGIGARRDFRHDLTMMYFPTLDMVSGELTALELVPLMIRNFRLQRPASSDTAWLRDLMHRECRALGGALVEREGRLMFEWG